MGCCERVGEAVERATAAGRKPLMPADFGVDPPDPEALAFLVASVDRIARLNIDDCYRRLADMAGTIPGAWLVGEFSLVAPVEYQFTRYVAC